MRVLGKAACVVMLVCAVCAEAQEESKASQGPRRLKDLDLPGLKETVSVNALTPWDIVQVIDYLAFKGGLKNIVVSKGVAGLTTKLKFENVPVSDAFEVVLSVNNLAYVIQSGIITVMTDAEYMTQYGVSFYDKKQVRVVTLKYADSARVASFLSPVKSALGTIVSDALTGNLILIDTPDRIKEMLAIVEKADLSTVSRVVPTETRTYVLQYAELDSIQKEIAPMVTPEVGSMRVDARSHTLIVTDLTNKLERVDALIRAFDRRPKEVFIEAKVVQVGLSDQYRLGIDWNHLFEGASPRMSLSSRATPPLLGAAGNAATAPGTGYGSLTYQTILAGGDLKIVLDALKTVGDTKILSNPHVAVKDGEEATIKVVRNEPYAETQFDTGTTNVVGESLKFIEVGVCLSVRPRINEHGVVSMSIKPEVSTVEGSYQARYAVPIVQKSYAETSVLIRDGETIIIAGMIEDTKAKSTTSVPLLGSIPLIGALFRSQSENMQSKELIVFLTPRIITGDEPVMLLRDVRKQPKGLRAAGEDAGKEQKPLR
jgi:type II secretory pathway component GspD/PulD (secretin)